jgi:hypothetical protein
LIGPTTSTHGLPLELLLVPGLPNACSAMHWINSSRCHSQSHYYTYLCLHNQMMLLWKNKSDHLSYFEYQIFRPDQNLVLVASKILLKLLQPLVDVEFDLIFGENVFLRELIRKFLLNFVNFGRIQLWQC